jgi:hypothetical protein
MITNTRSRFLFPARLVHRSAGRASRESSDDKPRKIAVLVAVKAYNHADLPDLEFTENDVTELGDLLSKADYLRRHAAAVPWFHGHLDHQLAGEDLLPD